MVCKSDADICVLNSLSEHLVSIPVYNVFA